MIKILPDGIAALISCTPFQIFKRRAQAMLGGIITKHSYYKLNIGFLLEVPNTVLMKVETPGNRGRLLDITRAGALI